MRVSAATVAQNYFRNPRLTGRYRNFPLQPNRAWPGAMQTLPAQTGNPMARLRGVPQPLTADRPQVARQWVAASGRSAK